MAYAHLDRVLDRPSGLLLQICRPSIPELRRIENRVQHRWRVPAPLLPFMADGRWQHVHAAKPDLMACVAADVVALRQTGIEKKRLAKFDHCRRCSDVLDRRRL